MPLHYVIDAYNIINHSAFTSIRKKIQDPQKALLYFIRGRRLNRNPGNKIVLVFDGYPGASAQGPQEPGIDIVFSRDKTADAKIKRMVEGSGRPGDIVVVSDDKEIIFFVKSAGARVMAAEEFINPAPKLQRKKEDLIKAELNYSQINKINRELKELWLKKE